VERSKALGCDESGDLGVQGGNVERVPQTGALTRLRHAPCG
jgi:hypothetical protein